VLKIESQNRPNHVLYAGNYTSPYEKVGATLVMNILEEMVMIGALNYFSSMRTICHDYSMATKPVFKFALTEDLLANCGGDLKPDDFLPKRADEDSTGWDVRCADAKGIDLKPECYIKIPLGFRALSPKGWWFKLVPRSSMFIKRHINSLYGTIDETYEGQLFFCGQYLPFQL